MNPSINQKSASSTNEERQHNPKGRVCVQMKGRLFSIPREDYERLKAEQKNGDEQGDHIRLISIGHCSKPLPASSLESTTTGYPRTPKTYNHSINTEDNTKPSMEHLFSRTSSGLTISKETLIEESSEQTSPKEHPVVPNNPELPHEDQRPPKPSVEMTEKLIQLRSSVVRTIDQFINQIETDHNVDDGNTAEGNAFSGSIPLHPSGDGLSLDYRKQNQQVLSTESFARNTKVIRTKLYREIDTLVKRLQDLDSLE
ncbi:uncharacterized protein LOC110674644 [Aedes aegypti]|uniref:Uncharacterized protein n=1 Tax=Aedes aegypti TaxID=7159 RepID=A0A6I8U4T7_AEDAE|nr:uncharacterized protein LOC110674644 [Aedes aegypti]